MKLLYTSSRRAAFVEDAEHKAAEGTTIRRYQRRRTGHVRIETEETTPKPSATFT